MLSDPMMRRVFMKFGKPKPETPEERAKLDMVRRLTISEARASLTNPPRQA